MPEPKEFWKQRQQIWMDKEAKQIKPEGLFGRCPPLSHFFFHTRKENGMWAEGTEGLFCLPDLFHFQNFVSFVSSISYVYLRTSSTVV